MDLKVTESVQSPLGSCLDSCQSSMARKLPGGQQVATGVLAGEAKVVARRSSSADTNRTKASIVSEEVTSGSQLGPSNTAQRFLAVCQNKLALILSEFKIGPVWVANLTQ